MVWLLFFLVSKWRKYSTAGFCKQLLVIVYFVKEKMQRLILWKHVLNSQPLSKTAWIKQHGCKKTNIKFVGFLKWENLICAELIWVVYKTDELVKTVKILAKKEQKLKQGKSAMINYKFTYFVMCFIYRKLCVCVKAPLTAHTFYSGRQYTNRMLPFRPL